ncbi:hypothetical protein BASA50_011392 [Batrachochytrium salamandrivorans]|uniref:Uncharacterized protein n=1 Tax=Batrachochytrium salamandrivorans TaxID=1357716 RepID=A0ABQ8EVZ9_9FUNG|nr:hypothetical protein BASA60_010945 [Batrachochytrium salamandrivorans]KAH6581282.1 hypothetical protein BASA61_009161 [Batrachochytrium salamandrivorans]KAH6587450.1 hypothetical protein BASA50_011392 [Batrachochytrium salamandrivorans]KAH9272375.1 hypothetical protein BASA83_005468 [Batrachochytrium salamandrivorans]
MKFSALVVAAMVITSVSAGKRKRIRGCSEGDDSNSGSVPPPELLESDGGPSQESDPTEENPADGLDMNGTKEGLDCGPIVAQLYFLRGEAVSFYWDWRRIYARYNRIERENGLSPEEMGNHYASRNDDPEMQEIESKLDLLEEEYRAAWGVVLSENCFTDSLESMSPERVIKNGYLRQWQDEADEL